MKKIEWANPNKMVINTGHKTFDRQCCVVSTGNVIAPTQYSCYVRAQNNTECNGFQFPAGHLRDGDLKNMDDMPSYVRKYVLSQTEVDKAIVYQFFHYASGKNIIHGYVVTDSAHKLLRKFVIGPTCKSYSVIDTVTEYIAD